MALFIISNSAFAQNYTMPLDGISKVVISAETTIVVEPNENPNFLLKASENVRDASLRKSKGLKTISTIGSDNTGYGVHVKKEGSLLIVRGLRDRRGANLVIRLPINTDISIESLANNEIYVNGLNSEIEAINHQGETVLSNITGPIVTENGNGNITITFSNFSDSSPTSIIADNGDIDVSLPIDASAHISAKTPRGMFYTDFDIALVGQETKNNGRVIEGKINNGSVEFSLQNLKGNIYLRQVR